MATQQAQNGRRVVDFTKVEYDATEMEPECPQGKWEATAKVKKHKSAEKGLPMLIVEWKLEDTDIDEHKTHLGKSIGDFIGFPKKDEKGANFRKLHLRKLCEALEIPLETIPRGTLESWDQLEPLIEAIDGSKCVIWTIQKKQESGEVRVNVAYAEPANFNASGSDDEDEEAEDEEEAPAKGKGKAALKSVKGGKAARR